MHRRSVGRQAAQPLNRERGETSAAVIELRATLQDTGGVTAGQPCVGHSPIGAIDPVRQSWRQWQTMISGPAILALVPAAEQRRLLTAYVNGGGVWPVASASEKAAFLEFLTAQLPDPSHALSLCRMAVALTRAAMGAEVFVEPEYRSVQERGKRDVRMRIEYEAWNCIERALQAYVVTDSWNHIERTSWDSVESAVWDGIERDARSRLECSAWEIVERSARTRIEPGRYASFVWFHAEPGSVLRALHGAELPPVGKPARPVLFGPGVPNLCRAATPEEVVLWASLPADDTAPDLVERLLAEGIVSYAD